MCSLLGGPTCWSSNDAEHKVVTSITYDTYLQHQSACTYGNLFDRVLSAPLTGVTATNEEVFSSELSFVSISHYSYTACVHACRAVDIFLTPLHRNGQEDVRPWVLQLATDRASLRSTVHGTTSRGMSLIDCDCTSLGKKLSSSVAHTTQRRPLCDCIAV